MKVLITGANGMLGADLCEAIRKYCEVFPTDIEELDVRIFDKVEVLFSLIKPDIVFHLAAITDVDFCEHNPDEAFQSNTIGTKNIALACQQANSILLYISTLSVFDGSKPSPYIESDIPCPINVYAKSKYEGELIIQSLLNRYYIVRTGWLFGGGLRDKKFVSQILKAAKENKLLKVVNDKFGSPTFTRDLSKEIVSLVMTNRFGIYHLVNSGKICSRYDYAQKILEIVGNNKCLVEGISSSEWPTMAARPMMEAGISTVSDLANELRPWEDALNEYLKNPTLNT